MKYLKYTGLVIEPDWKGRTICLTNDEAEEFMRLGVWKYVSKEEWRSYKVALKQKEKENVD